MEFKENLKRLRQESNLSQLKLAEELGVKQYTINDWESGRGEPNVAMLKSIAKFFYVTMDDLLGYKLGH